MNYLSNKYRRSAITFYALILVCSPTAGILAQTNDQTGSENLENCQKVSSNVEWIQFCENEIEISKIMAAAENATLAGEPTQSGAEDANGNIDQSDSQQIRDSILYPSAWKDQSQYESLNPNLHSTLLYLLTIGAPHRSYYEWSCRHPNFGRNLQRTFLQYKSLFEPAIANKLTENHLNEMKRMGFGNQFDECDIKEFFANYASYDAQAKKLKSQVDLTGIFN